MMLDAHGDSDIPRTKNVRRREPESISRKVKDLEAVISNL
jgi:hypothetical protein